MQLCRLNKVENYVIIIYKNYGFYILKKDELLMDFNQCYEIIKDKYMRMDMSGVGKDFRGSVHLTGNSSGFVYLAYIDGCKLIEPLKTEKADIFVSMTISCFEDIISGRLDPVLAFTTGQIQAKGNVMLALSLYNSLK